MTVSYCFCKKTVISKRKNLIPQRPCKYFLAIWLSQYKFLINESLIKSCVFHENEKNEGPFT